MSFNTKILKVEPSSIEFAAGSDLPTVGDAQSLANLTEAAKVLVETSNPVAFPTETVYGLGGSALNTQAVKNIYSAKNRPADNPLILHVASVSQLKRKLLPNSEIPSIYQPLIEHFWPGPLTILLPVPANSDISPATTVGQPTFAVRLPGHPVARALIAISDLPLAAPSANTSTRPSPTLAEHVYSDLNGKIPIILDGGPSDVGVESTVIDGLSNPPILLRPGGVSAEEIKQYGGPQWANMVVAKGEIKDNEIAKTPGMKYKHYSPKAPVILFKNCGSGVGYIDRYLASHSDENSKIAILTSQNFNNPSLREKVKDFGVEFFSLGTNAKEMSHNLFAQLRRLDVESYDLILVEGIDESHQGLAVMNRLTKAASLVITPAQQTSN